MISLGTWAPSSPSANPKRRQQGEEEKKERAGALHQWLQQREAGKPLLLPPPARL
jgi:hypothetical protein